MINEFKPTNQSDLKCRALSVRNTGACAFYIYMNLNIVTGVYRHVYRHL